MLSAPLCPQKLGTGRWAHARTTRASPSREKDAELQRAGLAPPRHACVEAGVAASGSLVLPPSLFPRAIPENI